MTVSDWMTPNPVTVAPDAGLIEVLALFKRHRCRHLPVVADERIVGVISDRDALQELSPFLDTISETGRDVDTLAREARSIMTPDPLTVPATSPLADAARRMVEDVVSSLLVVDDEGKLVGILTARDVLRATAGVAPAAPRGA